VFSRCTDTPQRSLNRVPASAGVKATKVTGAGWQVTLCDPIWYVISCSGVVISTNCYTRLLYFTSQTKFLGQGFKRPNRQMWPNALQPTFSGNNLTSTSLSSTHLCCIICRAWPTSCDSLLSSLTRRIKCRRLKSSSRSKSTRVECVFNLLKSNCKQHQI